MSFCISRLLKNSQDTQAAQKGADARQATEQMRLFQQLVRRGTALGYPRCGYQTQGSILLYVVWAVVILSVFASSVGSQALFALNLSERLSDELQAEYIARGATHYAALTLQRDTTPSFDGLNDVWVNPSSGFHQHPLAGGWFTIKDTSHSGEDQRYGLADEERRINLNTAPIEVLQELMEIIGALSPEEATAISQAIGDWRDEDDQQRPLGAEGFYYRSLRKAYDCKNGPFENVEELLLVKGLSRELYRSLEPYVTVYGSGRMNLNTASPVVLRTLGLSEAGVRGILDFRQGEDQQDRTEDDRPLSSLGAIESELKSYVPQEDIVRLMRLSQEFLTIRSEAFRMEIEAAYGGPSGHVQGICIIDRQGRVKLWSVL